MKKYLIIMISGIFISLLLLTGSMILSSPSCVGSLKQSMTGFVAAELTQNQCETVFNSCSTDCNAWLDTCNQKCDSGSIIEECYSYCSKQDPNCSGKCATTYDTCFKAERQKRTPLSEITKLCTQQKNTCEQECNPKIGECRESCKQKTDPASCKQKCATKKQETCDKSCNTGLEQCKVASTSTRIGEEIVSTSRGRQTQQQVASTLEVRTENRGSEVASVTLQQTAARPQQSIPTTSQQQPQPQIKVDDYKKRIDALLDAVKNGKVTDENFAKNMERLQKTFPQLNTTQAASLLKDIKAGVKTYDDLKQLLYQSIETPDTQSLSQKSEYKEKDNKQEQGDLEEAPDDENTVDEEKNKLQEETDDAIKDAIKQDANVEESDLNPEEDDLEQWLDEEFTDDTADTTTSVEDEFTNDESDAFGSDDEFDISTFEEEFNTDDYGFDDFGTDDADSFGDEFNNEATDEFSDTELTDQSEGSLEGIDATTDQAPFTDGELTSEEDLSLEQALGEEVLEEETPAVDETQADAEQQTTEEEKKDLEAASTGDKIIIKQIDGTDVRIIDETITQAHTGAIVREKTRIVTGQESSTNIDYKKNIQARIDQNSEVLVKKLEKKNFVESVRLKQETGTSTYKITKTPEIKPDIETPNAIVRIDGVVEVNYHRDSLTTTVRVFEGKAYVTSLVKKSATPEPLTEKQQTTIKGKPNLLMRIANALR